LIGNLVKRAFDQKSQDVESYTSRQEFSTWFARYPKLLPLFVELLQKNETEVSASLFLVVDRLSLLYSLTDLRFVCRARLLLFCKS
jgi:hypothetical protein